MNKDIVFNKIEFLSLYKKLYAFLRQDWDLTKVRQLKSILLKYIDSSRNIDNNTNVIYHLILEMRTAIIAIDEIGLKQPTVCAILLFRPILNDNSIMKSVTKLFGDRKSVV